MLAVSQHSGSFQGPGPGFSVQNSRAPQIRHGTVPDATAASPSIASSFALVTSCHDVGSTSVGIIRVDVAYANVLLLLMQVPGPRCLLFRRFASRGLLLSQALGPKPQPEPNLKESHNKTHNPCRFDMHLHALVFAVCTRSNYRSITVLKIPGAASCILSRSGIAIWPYGEARFVKADECTICELPALHLLECDSEAVRPPFRVECFALRVEVQPQCYAQYSKYLAVKG